MAFALLIHPAVAWHGEEENAVDATVFGSTDPSGVCFYPPNGTLLLVDSEVEETPFFLNANMWELQLDGTLVQSFDLTTLTEEPTGITYNPVTGTLFVTDDDVRVLLEVEIVGSSVQLLATHDLTPFGIGDPEGITCDADGDLWVVDGGLVELFELTPQGQLLSSLPLPATVIDPESVAWHDENGTFLVGSAKEDSVFEVDAGGVIQTTIDLHHLQTAYGGFHFKGLGIAPSSDPGDDPGDLSFVCAHYGSDEENDGRLHELVLDQAPVLAPVAPQTLEEGEVVVVPLSATDVDGDALSFSSADLPAFATLDDLGDGTAELTLAPGAGQEGSYAPTVEVLGSGCALLTDEQAVSIEVSPGPAIGTNYCGSVANSTGLGATISAAGSTAVVDDDVTLTASDLPPNKPGYFLASPSQAFIANPGGSQGNLCLGGTVARYAASAQKSSGTGSFSLALDLQAIPYNPPQAVMPGETWNFQAWFRDKNPDKTSNFTDGIAIPFD